MVGKVLRVGSKTPPWWYRVTAGEKVPVSITIQIKQNGRNYTVKIMANGPGPHPKVVERIMKDMQQRLGNLGQLMLEIYRNGEKVESRPYGPGMSYYHGKSTRTIGKSPQVDTGAPGGKQEVSDYGTETSIDDVSGSKTISH